MAPLPDAPVTPSIVVIAEDSDMPLQRNGGSIVTEIHEGSVPPSAAAALDRLYGSLYGSLRHLQLCGLHDASVNSWVCYQHGEVTAVLLFRIEQQKLLVLTEMVPLSRHQAEAFARALFSRHPQLNLIAFNALIAQFDVLDFPSQRYIFSENYILDLPASAESYLASLGKATRKTIKGYGNRLRKDFPDFSWRACEAQELSATLRQSLLNQLQLFKQASMAARHKQAATDAEETRRMLELAAECGLFGMATINGEIRAGSLACRIGDNYVMLVSAADPALEQYRLGLLVCYWSVCDCIARKARQCHLLWGRYQYKSQLLAVPYDLQRCLIYRSHSHMLLRPAIVFSMVAAKLHYRLRHWLLVALPQRRDCCSVFLHHTLLWLRRCRQHWQSRHGR
jgi:hypothetical protein